MRLGSACSLDTICHLSRKFASIARKRQYKNLGKTITSYQKIKCKNNTLNFSCCILPTIWQIYPWIWTRRAMYCTLPLLCTNGASGIMSTTPMFEHFDVTKLTHDDHKRPVMILVHIIRMLLRVGHKTTPLAF